jgi:hypothetical protein
MEISLQAVSKQPGRLLSKFPLKLDVSVFDISDGLHLYAALHDETNIIV